MLRPVPHHFVGNILQYCVIVPVMHCLWLPEILWPNERNIVPSKCAHNIMGMTHSTIVPSQMYKFAHSTHVYTTCEMELFRMHVATGSVMVVSLLGWERF